MGVCYSVEDDWQDQNVETPVVKKVRRRKKKHFSAIEEQKTQYDGSFASVVEDELRNSLYQSIQESAELSMTLNNLPSSVVMGSVVEMGEDDQAILFKNLEAMNMNAQTHTTQPVRLCNFKTKNFLHTHRVKLEKSHHFNQISCCPFDVNHNIDYDTWVFQSAPEHGTNYFAIFHPFTKKYINAIQNIVAAGQDKYIWEIEPLGTMRNQGFIRIKSQNGYLCMSDTKGLLKNHRGVCACDQSHISHLWEVIFVEEQTTSQNEAPSPHD